MTQFEVRTSTDSARAVVTLAGECDLANRDALVAALRAAADRAPVVVVDLARLEFLDSSGLDGLVTGYRVATERGGQLYVVNAGGVVARVLDITGVGGLLGAPPDGAGAPS